MGQNGKVSLLAPCPQPTQLAARASVDSCHRGRLNARGNSVSYLTRLALNPSVPSSHVSLLLCRAAAYMTTEIRVMSPGAFYHRALRLTHFNRFFYWWWARGDTTPSSVFGTQAPLLLWH